MKKLLGIIVLAVLLIFAAGCVTTEDQIVGTWKLTEPVVDGEDTYTGTLTFEADGTGTAHVDYSDGFTYINQIEWMLAEDGTYWVEELYFVKLQDDGTITDYVGYSYQRVGDGEGVLGTWKSETVGEGDYKYQYLFNEDGTGTETMIYSDGEKDWRMFQWETADNGIILYRALYPYSWEGETLTLRDEYVYQYVEGDKYLYESDGFVSTLEFFENGTAVDTSIYEDGTEEIYHFSYVDEGDSAADEGTGVLTQLNLCQYVIEDDGTLLCPTHGQRFAKVIE